jgi:hypothetical protein
LAIPNPFSATSRFTIVARAFYTDAGGLMWAAGTNATATRLP